MPHMISPEEIQGAPRRTGRFWFDFLAASAAIFISVVSLIIGMRGESIQRELLAANSWPFVQVSEERNDRYSSIEIRNDGVGPAKVMSFEVFYDGKPATDIFDLLQRCCGLPTDLHKANDRMGRGIGTGDVAGNVIRPDQSRLMIRMDRPPGADPLIDALDAHMARLKFRSCYCSILDRCWISNLRTLKPTEVASCPVPEHPFDLSEPQR